MTVTIGTEVKREGSHGIAEPGQLALLGNYRASAVNTVTVERKVRREKQLVLIAHPVSRTIPVSERQQAGMPPVVSL